MPANNHVGAKIKGLRELRSVTVEELSERCGLPVEQIQKIEAGDVATSLTPLLKIARGLGCRLGTFLDDATVAGPIVSSPSKGGDEGVRFVGAGDKNGLVFHALAANKADRNMEPFIIEVNPPENSSYEVSSHEGEEFMYVLEGELEIDYGRKIFHVKAGESIYYDSIVPHHVHAAGGKVAKILAVVYAPH